MAIFEQINSYLDLKVLSYDELDQLAGEIRDCLIENVSQTGGHLAPSLGVVELTLALLRVYDPHKDKIIWDVGHQVYTYKLLTNRKEQFPTLRQWQGISGFPKREESELDHWGTGHASTSISAALGMSIARDLKGEEHNVIAIIGDGALTGGLAFEGMNNAGSAQSEILVIVNDNEMSITENVGALSKYLTEIITNPLYRKLKSEIWDITGKLSQVGKPIRAMARKLQESVKNLVVPGILFEELGFSYYGPIDGHNIRHLEHILAEIKEIKQPKILHVATQKGKGYKFAEDDAPKFHGIGSFNPKTGQKTDLSSRKTYTEVFGETMVELGQKYDNLVAISAAMSLGTGLFDFSRKYPGRFFDVGIAEEHAVLFGTALAAQGFRSVVALYSTFLQRAFDQLIHDAALQKIPVVLAIDRAGVVGEDGPTHNGTFDLSYLRLIPDMVVAAPKDKDELRNLLYTAINWDKGPFAIRYPRSLSEGLENNEEFRIIPPGSWEELVRGEEAVILACGSMIAPAQQAVNKLVMFDRSLGLVNCRYIKPLDEELLVTILSSYRYIVTLEENTLLGGFGSSILEFAFRNNFNKNLFLNLGISDKFVPQGGRDEILQKLGLDTDNITNQILAFLERTRNGHISNQR
ncbi:1-deoxy-D-xylulose-5-phosphate synthase [bacterium]|nr:1-deoxy-D-xylulose-5-phosphate synthase [bacterium]